MHRECIGPLINNKLHDVQYKGCVCDGDHHQNWSKNYDFSITIMTMAGSGLHDLLGYI